VGRIKTSTIATFRNRFFHYLRRIITAIEHFDLFIQRSRISPDLYIELNHPWLTGLNIKTILDIGAHTGKWAYTVHKLFKGARIYSFEPILESFEALKQRMSDIANHQAFNVALGDHSGEIEFHVCKFATSSSILPMTQLHKTAFPYSDGSTSIKVQITRLDDIVEKLEIEHNILIKIDVQGYEDKVIDGGEQTIKRAKVVIMEMSFQRLYENQPLFSDIYDKMIYLGFDYMGNLAQTINPFDGSILQEDAIFISKS